MTRATYTLSLLLTAFALTGCGSGETDTGYTPRHLSMNGTQVRALYAPAFSPEAQNTTKGEQDQTIHNMPHAGPGGF
jgi:hypothetical protein